MAELSTDKRLQAIALEVARMKTQFSADILAASRRDYHAEVARGNIDGESGVNKFGRSTNVDSGVTTDLWDRANATNDQDIWLAPTAARIHTIASDSANDVTGGTGANSVTIWYLSNWDTAEASETKTGNLNGGIAMDNAAVIINRMKVNVQSTSTTPNAGTITATAATDSTVTAQINPGEGQTQMAIYGIPSTQTFEMDGFYQSILRANLSTNERHADIQIVCNDAPDVNTTVFIVKHTGGCGTRAGAPYRHDFRPPKTFSGPCILKLQSAGSAADLDISGGFDGVNKDN